MPTAARPAWPAKTISADGAAGRRRRDSTWRRRLAELNYLRKEGQLPDNLPRQLQLRMIDVTPELTGVLMETVVKHVDKPFDSRPSDADRLTAIATEPAAGEVTSDLPAWHLFANFDKLAGEMTWEYYSVAYGKQLVHAALKPVELPVRRRVGPDRRGRRPTVICLDWWILL